MASDINADGLQALEGVTPVVGDVAKDENARAGAILSVDGGYLAQ